MSRQTVRAHAGQDRTNLYDEITDKIIAELEAGRVPWVQPWGTAFVVQSATGVVLQHWTPEVGHYPEIAYQTAFAFNLAGRCVPAARPVPGHWRGAGRSESCQCEGRRQARSIGSPWYSHILADG
jgi:hypothetical protein